jgi:hypothetical protein
MGFYVCNEYRIKINACRIMKMQGAVVHDFYIQNSLINIRY